MTIFTTIDPTTGKPLERFSYLSDRELETRLSQTHAIFAKWRLRSFEERGAILREVASRLRAQSDALARTAVREMGKPIVQARAEVEKCAWACEFFADNAASMLADETIQTSAARSYVSFRPLGAIFAIMPWNFPYWQVFRAAAPALMSGNVVLLKHADSTTRCALEIERIFRESGAEDGIFSTLLIDHGQAGALVGDERVRAVTLTGSERAGVAIASAAGRHLKKCVLELGGSDAFVVLNDADLDLAARTAITARFQNNGQSCIAAKRFIIEDAVHDEFLARFESLARAQILGDPMDESTDIGPCARGDLMQTLHRQVHETIARGARLALGGKTVERDGHFYEPTIVCDVIEGMPMFDEEVFGPAAAVIRARDAQHALTLANASSYGLGFSIWTSDTQRAQQFAASIEAGSVFINGMVTSDPRLPFGGVKHSGYGRELSRFGIHEFTNIQTVWIGAN